MSDTTSASSSDAQSCPKCQGPMWDNRAENAERKARGERLRPDFKCQDSQNCDGIIWPPRDENEPRPEAGPPKGTPDDPACPTCGGKMWDNRKDKRNPKAPDFKCRNAKKTGCDGVIWPPRDGESGAKGAKSSKSATKPAAAPKASASAPSAGNAPDFTDFPDFPDSSDDASEAF